MADDLGILLGGRADGGGPVHLLPRFANRHGLIAGATGTGKTVSVQILAEGLAARGVPVFLADVKGDLAGLAFSGSDKPHFAARAKQIGLDWGGKAEPFRAMPALLWDLFGSQGHRARATVSDLGPQLLARLLDLNDTQTGVLNLAFKVADEDGLLLLDLKDLRALLTHVADEAPRLTKTHGTVSTTSIGAIQRALLVLEQQGGVSFFGEPVLDLFDLMRSGPGGGYVSLLAADQLMQRPRLYATFLLWLLSELYENLPEAGDLPQPKLVLVFDEAHLLFDEAPKALVDKVEQVVRLIRSKGVGVWFVTQNPLDIPDSVLGQLGNRIQHALRAFTPRDQKAVKAAADTFRPNPKLKTAQVITELGIGEALVSVLDESGAPCPVERVLIRPPVSRVGAASAAERAALIAASPLAGKYDRDVDRESAFEKLRDRAAPEEAAPKTSVPRAGRPWGAPPAEAPPPRATGRVPKTLTQTTTERVVTNMASSAARTIGTQIGRAVLRGIMGSILKR